MAALLHRFEPTEQSEFSREFHVDLADAIDRDARGAVVGPKARAYVAEHARILAEAALFKLIDADDRAETLERIVADVLRGL